MNKPVVALLFLIFTVLSFLTALPEEKTLENYQLYYFQWIQKYKKVFSTTEEFTERFRIFKANYDFIERHNANPQKTYELECNKFCDTTWSEFKQQYLLNEPQNCSATANPRITPHYAPPKSIDWRDRGVVTPVKNQGKCGSCWTFSTTGSVESHFALKTGSLISLSEQQLVDCAQDFNNHGCHGGLPSQAFEYVRYNGIESEESYPYTATDDKCKYNPDHIVTKTKGSYNFTQGDEEGVYNGVGTIGPVSIAFQVVSDFRFYKSGVYQSNDCKQGPEDVNHAVLLVGYNTTSEGVPYGIVKNSWGTDFGIDGYFWIVRGKNMCGLATCASYPLV